MLVFNVFCPFETLLVVADNDHIILSINFIIFYLVEERIIINVTFSYLGDFLTEVSFRLRLIFTEHNFFYEFPNKNLLDNISQWWILFGQLRLLLILMVIFIQRDRTWSFIKIWWVDFSLLSIKNIMLICYLLIFPLIIELLWVLIRVTT